MTRLPWLALIAFVLGLGAAASGVVRRALPPAVPPPPAESDAEIYRRVCTGCHPLVSARRLSVEAWPAQVELMELFAAERAIVWTAEEKEAVLRYLTEHGR